MVNWWIGIRNRKGFVTAITPYNLTILSQSFYMVLKSKHISFFYFQNNMRNFIISGQISTTIIIICYRLESLRLKTSNLKFMIKLCRPFKERFVKTTVIHLCINDTTFSSITECGLCCKYWITCFQQTQKQKLLISCLKILRIIISIKIGNLVSLLYNYWHSTMLWLFISRQFYFL